MARAGLPGARHAATRLAASPVRVYDGCVRGRRLIVAAWLAGGGLAAFLLVGCCILPFHGLVHRLVPLCEMAAAVVTGGDASHGHGHGHDHPAAPAERQDGSGPGARHQAGWQPAAHRGLQVVLAPTADRPLDSPARYRTLVSLGATRLDEDVGARLSALDTLRI